MKKIRKTKQLEFDKSTFIIDLVEVENGQSYIEVLQRIHNEKSEGQRIKINPSVLMDLINTLLEFQQMIPPRQKEGIVHFTESDKKAIQDRYLKGISSKDLAMQFDTTEAIIEMILRNRKIVVMSDVTPVPKKRWWRKRKKG